MYPESEWRDERDGDLRPDADAEARREARWWAFEVQCRLFAAKEPDGFAAVLRAVSRAMQDDKKR